MTFPKIGYLLRPISTSSTIKNTVELEQSENLYKGYSASGQDVWLPYFDYDGPAIVLSAVGAQCGKTFLADGKWGTVANTTAFAVDIARASSKFLHYLTNQKDFWEKGGSAQPYVKVSETLRRRFFVPNLPTQRAIADFLDRETARIDTLIEKKQRLVELLGEKFEAMAAALSTGSLSSDVKVDSKIDWLGYVPSSWSVEKVYWHFYASKGRDAQKYTKEYCGANEGEHPVYSGQTSNEGVMGRIDTYDYDFGETGVLFATTVGAKAMDLRHLIGKFSLSQNCMIIIPRRRIPLKFFLYQMRVLFRKERQLIPDHMQASFRVEDLYRYRIALPPLDIAERIGLEIEKAENAFNCIAQPVSASIERLKEYRSALITSAVTGQIDVTKWTNAETTDRQLDAIEEEFGA